MPPHPLPRRSAFQLLTGTLSLAALAPLSALAAPGFGELTLSDQQDATKGVDTFKTGTPKVYLVAKLVDVPRGAKVSSAWIAESTKVAPPNYVIDTAEITVGLITNVATFTMTKPNNGWPVGSYRVDLAINGQKMASVKFKVE